VPASLRKVLRLTTRYASGEIAGRLFSVAAMMLLGHAYGVQIFGVYALAVAASWYTVPFIDFGLRHIGTRLIARYPAHGKSIIDRVQKQRMLMAIAAIPLLAAYAAFARIPANLRLFLFLFSGTSLLYSMSLDWVAWGKERLQLQTLTRALVPCSILLFLIVGHVRHGQVLWWAVIGNTVGYVFQILILWRWWRNTERRESNEEGAQAREDVFQQLHFRRTWIMGVTWFAQMAFNSIDVLMLGLISNSEQVGLYSSAYRILTQVLVAYYWIILPLFPMLARQDPHRRQESLRPRILLTCAGLGLALAVPAVALRRIVLVVVFGPQFATATTLVAVLAWAIPLDFITSYLNNVFLAWGMEKQVLPAIGIAAGINIISNLIFIPKYGAMAAALNTILAYFVYLVGLFVIAAGLPRSKSAVEL
jgi:O-antigen/teichoic acid export membrane protein